MEKPNCYKCKYRGTISGDAHSCCKYPGNIIDMFGFFSERNRDNARKLKIVGNEHGIRSGWFMWPINFDPVWLENCEGFVENEAI